MFTPIFYTDPTNPDFAPVVSHPGDAGADICACTDGYDKEKTEQFFKEFKRQPPSASANKPGLYVDGVKEAQISLKEFDAAISAAGGAVFLAPGQTVLVNSGFKIIMPNPSEFSEPFDLLMPYYQIVSRSGLACKHGIVVTNSPGIVDYGYRDWVKVSLTNNSKNYHAFTHGARIAQGILGLAVNQQLSMTTSNSIVLDETARQEGGFGSTGV